MQTVRIPAAGRSAVIEVEIVAAAPPRAWRRRLALWLVRLAGRLVAMRVRVTDVVP